MDEELVWTIRAYVYNYFAKTALAPEAGEAAKHFGLNETETAEIYEELHRRHALFLDPTTKKIRMAWPFSGVPTRFRARINEITYWANCAWDSLGIPAALDAEAEIEAYDAWTDEPIQLTVRAGQVIHSGERILFSTPFKEWYEDLVFT